MEFKVRVWHKEEKKMISWEQLQVRWNTLTCLTWNCFDIMRFLGIQDDNGVDLYENDIVQISTESCEPYPSNTEIGILCYDKMGVLSLKQKDGVYSDIIFEIVMSGIPFSIKKIGTIYEEN